MARILIVEDNKKLLALNKKMLEQAGFGVETATDGAKAIEIIDRQDVDLVLLDLLTPEINGFGVLEHTHEKGYKTPIIVLTNLSQKIDRQQCAELGAADFIVKSGVDLPQLLEKVKEFIRP